MKKEIRQISLLLMVMTLSNYPAYAHTEEAQAPVEVVPPAVKQHDKLVAITFDDGPSNATTEKTLKVLKQYGVKATFFVIGENVQNTKGLVREISSQGHEIANHSYTHPQLSRLSADRVRQELDKTNKAIVAETGVLPIWFRPPYGAYNKNVGKVASELGLRTIKWTVDPRDWAGPSAATIEQRVMKELQPGSVVLLHENHPHTLEALPVLFERMTALGYKFVTINELETGHDKLLLADQRKCTKNEVC
jgi:peptidoglycan/xylan/chitin deacetylase (PgdA/CDA1 family)